MKMEPGHFMTWEAQMAVADPKQYPEFTGTVYECRHSWLLAQQRRVPYWHRISLYHNAETYVLIGDALGRAMVRGFMEVKLEKIKPFRNRLIIPALNGSILEKLPQTTINAALTIRLATTERWDRALKPMIMSEMVPGFLETALGPRSRSLKGIVTGKKPSRLATDIRGELDELIDFL